MGFFDKKSSGTDVIQMRLLGTSSVLEDGENGRVTFDVYKGGSGQFVHFVFTGEKDATQVSQYLKDQELVGKAPKVNVPQRYQAYSKDALAGTRFFRVHQSAYNDRVAEHFNLPVIQTLSFK